MKDSRKFNWSGWLAFAVLLLLWDVGSRLSPQLQLYIPPVSQIVATLGQLMLSGQIVTHFIITLGRFCEGYFLAAFIAVVLGVVLGYYPLAHSLLETVVEFLRPMPSVAIIPVAVLSLGIGDSMIAAVTVYASVWPILMNTIDGVRHIDPTLIDTGRTFGLSRRRILWRVILPAASPYIVTGLRVSLSIALILVTTAEMIVGSRGLGFFILDEERSLHSTAVYAGIIVVALLGYALNRVFVAVERKAMKWRHGMISRAAI